VETLYLVIIVFIAALTQGLSGFGFGLVSLPFLLMLLDVKTAVPLVTLFGICISTTLSVQLRDHVQFKRIVPLLLASLPGMILGVQLLRHVRAGFLELLIGLLLVTFPLYLLLSGPRRRELPGGWKWAAGFLSGILGGSIAANGPPVIIYTSLQPWSKGSMKSTLVGYFLLSGICIIIMHWTVGLITRDVLNLFALGFFPVMAGVLAGSFFFGKLDTGAYRKVVTILLLVLGIYMLSRSVL
jgi:uncharacterized membrane protein YfcA